MKIFSLIFIAFAFSFQSQAHEYFFGFAELAYNEVDKHYEGTLILSTHDVEEWLVEKDVLVSTLEEHQEDLDMHFLISLEVFEGFKVKAGGKHLDFHIVGYEILENGMTQFYFTSKTANKATTLDVTFDLMMKEYPKQQNKINYIDNNKSVTAVFLANKTTSSISI